MNKTWSNTLLVAYSHLPKIEKAIDFGVENLVNSGFRGVHFSNGVSNEQLYEKILKLIDEKRKIVNVCYLVDSGLNALKDNHRLLLELRYVYQKTIQEISTTHGIPMRTLYRKLEDALTRFQIELSRMGFDEEFLEKEYSSSPFISKIHNALDTEKFNTACK